MALGATIFKVTLQLCDMNRHYYAEHHLTLARHPSETDERMMMRLLAFARHASAELSFTKGLCVDEEPDLWQKNLTNEIELWIDIGLPEERRLRKAASRAGQVALYIYGGRGADLWWQRNSAALQRFSNLSVVTLSEADSRQLTSLVQRHMVLQCTIQEDEMWFSSGDKSIQVAIEHLKRSS